MPPLLVDACTCQGEQAKITAGNSSEHITWFGRIRERFESMENILTNSHLTILSFDFINGWIEWQVKIIKWIQLETWKDPAQFLNPKLDYDNLSW